MNLSAQGTHIIDWAMSLNNDAPIVRVFGTASGPELLDSTYPAPMPHRAKSYLKMVSTVSGTPVLYRHG